MDLQKIQKDFEGIIKYSQNYNFNLNSERLIRQWKTAKQPFIDAFGGKTIWRSGEKISLKLTEEAKEERFQTFLEELCSKGLLSCELDSFLQDNKNGFFSNKVVKENPIYGVHQGSKLVKSFKHFFPNDNSSIRIAQDIASKFIQEDKIEGELFLSVDPRDFLTISENNCQWRSCHALDGDYRAGNINYMVDNTTLIAYISNGIDEQLLCMPKGMLWNSKKWRMLVHTNLSTNIYFSKPYPYKHNMLQEIIFDTVKEVLFPEKKEEFNLLRNGTFNKVSLSDGTEYYIDSPMIAIANTAFDMRDCIDTSDSLGFVDIVLSSSYLPIIAVNRKEYYRCSSDIFRWKYDKQKVNESFKKVFYTKIGKKAFCPCCGINTLNYDEFLVCEDCLENNGIDGDNYCFCSICGRRIYNEDEAIKDEEGLYYCDDCAKVNHLNILDI